ncbi:MAG: SDR family NAD(P)-dependent oxidoreductase [Xanthomonadales bacterium]|nr:SDR family NAD(P)-dependent oxidoreductase [Xanthomonadales bacterium]
MSKVLITGNSSGLGLGLATACLARGDHVYGISRRGAPSSHPRLKEVKADLEDLEQIQSAVNDLLRDVQSLNLIVLNAGILGPIQPMHESSMDTLQQVMTVNVWANKMLLDALIHATVHVDQALLISSGAAVNGSFGWSAYAMSKAALNMLTQLYAHEMPQTHLTALAPGLVDTAMQDVLCDEVDAQQFPSVNVLRAARGTTGMPGPERAAELILGVLPRLRTFPSGSFVDIRQLN